MTEAQEDLERRERPAFEKWAKANGFVTRRPDLKQGYMALTQVAWKAWLGRAALGVQGGHGGKTE